MEFSGILIRKLKVIQPFLRRDYFPVCQKKVNPEPSGTHLYVEALLCAGAGKEALLL